MFSTGQLIFALLFVLIFISIIIRAYKKDKTEQPDYFKGSFQVLIAIAILLIILFTIKIFIVA